MFQCRGCKAHHHDTRKLFRKAEGRKLSNAFYCYCYSCCFDDSLFISVSYLFYSKGTSYDSRPSSASGQRRSGSVASTFSVSSRRNGASNQNNLPTLKSLRKQFRNRYGEKTMNVVNRYVEDMETSAEVINNINYLRRCRDLRLIPREYWMVWMTGFFSQFPPDLIDWLFFRWSNWLFSDDVVISAMFCSSEIVRWWPSSSDQFIYPQHEGSCPSAWRLLLSPYVSWSTILSASSNSTDQKAESNRGAVREASQSSRSTTSLQRSHTSSKSILWTDSWGPTQICRASSQG